MDNGLTHCALVPINRQIADLLYPITTYKIDHGLSRFKQTLSTVEAIPGNNGPVRMALTGQTPGLRYCGMLI